MPKAPLGPFLARNPFPDPRSLGLFYREKMRAIWRVSPEATPPAILDVGGGRGGLVPLLYPDADVTVLDQDPSYADLPVNNGPRVRYVVGDATALPFADGAFDAVTMFDLLEHVADDAAALAEAFRVLRPGGWLLVSTPFAHWRYPYFGFLRPWATPEADLFAAWGHVRRGYTDDDLARRVGAALGAGPRPPDARATFINAGTSFVHDLAFSRLGYRTKRALAALAAPVTWAAYALHGPRTRGSEIAAAWRKPAAP